MKKIYKHMYTYTYMHVYIYIKFLGSVAKRQSVYKKGRFYYRCRMNKNIPLNVDL